MNPEKLEFPFEEQGNDNLQKDIDAWKAAAFLLRQAEEREARAREALINSVEFLGHKKIEKSGVKMEKMVRKGVIEYNAVPQLANVDLEKYRRPATTYWAIKPSFSL